LGLSHVFGEARDLGSQTSYWRKQGWAEVFSFDLPVPTEKRRSLLFHRCARTLKLCYLQPKGLATDAGLEFLSHGPGKHPPPRKPALQLAFAGPSSFRWRDPGGNEGLVGDAFSFPVTIALETFQPADAADLLQRLGFSFLFFSEREREVLAHWVPEETGGWVLKTPLFPRRGVRVLLRKSGRKAPAPLVDQGGWSGFSMLTKNIQEVARRVRLMSPQRVRLPNGEERRVVFVRHAGVLMEIIQVIRS
jgi:hypothetical protein